MRLSTTWRPLLSLLSFSLLAISLVVLVWIVLSGGSVGWIITAVVVALASLVVGIMLRREVTRTCEVEAARERVFALQEQEQAVQAYQQRLEESKDEVLSVRQRVSEEIEAARQMVANRDQAAADKHLSAALDLMGDQAYRLCDHPSVDAMATLKLRACEEAGIPAQFALNIPRDVTVSPVDLCAVVGNLVDNGLEAAKRARDDASTSAPGQPTLDVRAFVKGAYLVVEVENSVSADDQRALAQDALLGPKDKERSVTSHGWGLLIVSSIANRYGGELITNLEGDRFRTRAVLGLMTNEA